MSDTPTSSMSQSPDIEKDGAARKVGKALCKAGHLVWRWSVPYNNRNRPIDPQYASVWGVSLDEANIRSTLHAAYPTYDQEKLPVGEEEIRLLLRNHAPLPPTTLDEESSSVSSEDQEAASQNVKSQHQKFQNNTTEEAWPHIPEPVRNMLASLNAVNMEKKLQILSEESYHGSLGQGSMKRSTSGISKTFRIWRKGFSNGISRFEYIGVNAFFIFLTFSAIYPDVAAGFLGERSYNQRSIGSRVVTLFQLFFLWTYPFHTFWLLFNWSLERLLGAFVGNTVYALVAIVPAIRTSYHATWFRTMMLILSLCWQITVQFALTVRDYIVRLLTRRQMRSLRNKGDTESVNWVAIDKAVNLELVSLKSYIDRQSQPDFVPDSWQDIPIKVRAERYIQFTSTFSLGRPADQLVGLLKDDMEVVINTYEDYRLSAVSKNGEEDQKRDRGHVEPRMPKLLLVFFDIAIFTYVCYSFWSQPFTFNTVVAYSTVVVIKQTIIAFKRYQTAKSARRLFTNMVSINLLGMLLVSTPVTVDKDVLQDDGNMVALTLAMVFATLFLAETIAPLLLALTEKMVVGYSWLSKKLQRRSEKESPRDKTNADGS